MTRLPSRLRPFVRDPRFRRLLLLSVLLGTSTSFVMPFMSMFGTLEVKMSLFAFGAFMTINAASGVAIATTLAHWSDVRITRRTMLLTGSLAGALGYLGYAFVRSYFPLLLIGSLLLGTYSVTFSQLFAYARELLLGAGVDPAENAFFINVFRMFIALAWTIGPAVASWVMVQFSFRGLFLCAALDLLLFAAVVAAGIRAEPPRLASSARGAPGEVLRVLVRVDVMAHFAAIALMSAAMTIGMMDLPLLVLETLGGTKADVGLTFCVAPVFEVPFMLLFGWLATRRGAAPVIRFGIVLSLVYYMALVTVRAPWQVFVCQSLAAAVTAVVSGVAITYFQGHLPRHPGTATNVYSNAQRIGSTTGYFLFVGLAWRLGFRYVFEGCAVLAVIALLLMMVPVHVPDDERLGGVESIRA